MRGVTYLGGHEGRQRCQFEIPLPAQTLTHFAEFTGTLMGFDDYVSTWWIIGALCASLITGRYGPRKCDRVVSTVRFYTRMYTTFLHQGSDYSGTQTKLSKILLNGNNICMVSGPRTHIERG